MKIRVQLFAIAKQRVGRSEIEVELPEPATVADLREQLSRQFPALADLLPQVRIAIDEAYAANETRLSENSLAAIIPPVSGG